MSALLVTLSQALHSKAILQNRLNLNEKLYFNITHLNYISMGSKWDMEPNITHIPPISRRRLSKCAKMAFGLTKDMIIDMPIIFSSYTGEINRCFDLLTNLKNEVSPTSFSLSVLNAIPAMLNIHAQNKSKILAISSRASFEYAIINALEFERALILSYFESLDNEFYSIKPFSIMIAAIISKGDKYSLSFNPSYQKADISEVRFLENFKNKKEWINHDGALAWKWQRNY